MGAIGKFRFTRKDVLYIAILLVINLFRFKIWKFKKKKKKIDRPIIHLYAVCRNEEQIIPFFMEYYRQFVSEFFIYDNYSDDNTETLLKEYPNVHIKKFDTKGTLNDVINKDIKNNAWKQSIGKADWIITCDMDEFLYHKNGVPDYLQNTKATIFKTTGIDMYSESFPKRDKSLFEQVNRGVYSTKYSKPMLFDPYKIIKTNYIIGAHLADPEGFVIWGPDDFSLLHFKNLGLDYIMKRVQSYRKRFSDINIKNDWGFEYF
ncbi:MAG: glycosyltransferase family 2 protein, partial [Prevotella sp.]|nr:glycosyltransferase family 2 protein [Prevotella sp.]